MNERIRELAEQADWYKPLGLPSDWDGGDYVVSPEGMKKFAELIVEECINVCKSRVGNSDYNTGRLHCVSDIRERFEFGMTTEDKKTLIKELLGVKNND